MVSEIIASSLRATEHYRHQLLNPRSVYLAACLRLYHLYTHRHRHELHHLRLLFIAHATPIILLPTMLLTYHSLNLRTVHSRCALHTTCLIV